MATPQNRLSGSRRAAPFNRFVKFGNSTKEKTQENYNKSVIFARKKPFTSFFIALGILLLVIILGSTIFRTKPVEVATRNTPKTVTVHKLSDNPEVTVQGEVKKSGVIQIVAQTPGIVSQINFKEGDYVDRGKAIINLSSNYQGGNAASLQRQLAGVTYQNTKETYDIQKGLIQRQRDQVERQTENAEGMREITQFSIDSTRSLVNLNGEILQSIEAGIQQLESTGGDPAQIQQLKQVQAQLSAGSLQLQTQLRSNEYTINEDNPPRDLERIGRDIALGQLDIQERGLEMSLKAAGIQSQLAQVQEANMFPSSPFAGIIQKINVKVGDSIMPGTPLITVAGESGEIVIDAKIPKEIADKVSRIDAALIEVNGKTFNQVPSFISSEATDGQLHSVVFSIGETNRKDFTDDSFVKITLPIGQVLTGTSIFVPVDSVFQTQDEAYVFVADRNKARSKKVKLGRVTGGFVEVVEGLNLRDSIITSRSVVEGDSIKVQN